ncbi:hypothetical protein SUDANB54_06982 [Streptomyces sp. enrichment culture]
MRVAARLGLGVSEVGLLPHVDVVRPAVLVGREAAVFAGGRCGRDVVVEVGGGDEGAGPFGAGPLVGHGFRPWSVFCRRW